MNNEIEIILTNGPAAAQTICSASDTKVVEIVHRLRNRRQLFRTVHALNELLHDPENCDHGRNALRRLGLDYGG
jgi:hypothetical protein